MLHDPGERRLLLVRRDYPAFIGEEAKGGFAVAALERTDPPLRAGGERAR